MGGKKIQRGGAKRRAPNVFAEHGRGHEGDLENNMAMMDNTAMRKESNE